MRLQTNLVRRGSRFYYRGRVPEDLKQHYCKTEFLISLKTSDRQIADYALAHVKARLLKEYSKLRGSSLFDESQDHTRNSVFGIAPKRLETTQEPPKALGPSIDTLITYWASQSEKRPRTLMEVDAARRRLVAIVGHNDASLMEKRHVIDLKDRLLADGLAIATIQKQLSLLKTVFQVAVTNDLIPINPFSGIKLVKPKLLQKSRIPFSAEDLKIIFNSPLFTQGLRPHGGAGETAIWLPQVALWTGMRLEEIGQLLVSDISLEQGIHFIKIEADSGKRLKTSSSNRRVPIHPELVKAGFLEYVDLMEVAGNKRLFPKISSTSYRQLTASWSQWFSRYLRSDIGISDQRKTFHSFRHGFKEACRMSGIPKDIHDYLTGHVSSDVGDGYGGDQYPLLALKTAIAKMQFEFVMPKLRQE